MTTTRPKGSVGQTGPAFSRSRSVYLIEAQALFVPVLADVFRDVGLHLLGVSSDVDLHQLLDEQPDVVFLDADYVSQDPLRLVNLLRTMVPQAVICVYTSERSQEWSSACHFAGANVLFSKNAHRREIVAGLLDALSGGTGDG
jgi:DNA-binding NarL/FixJ family response regulator